MATGKYASVFNQAFGDKPKKLEIFFISNDAEQSCFERYECRDNAGKLAGHADGKDFFLWDLEKKRYIVEDNKEKLKAAGKWQPVLTIRFVIPKINTVFGLWELSTKGDKSSIPAIRDTFDTVLNGAKTVIGVPFDLTVEKVKSQKPGEKSLFPVITMVCNIGASNLKLLSDYALKGGTVNQLQALSNENIKELTSA